MEKRTSREHTKTLNANVRVRPDVTFGLWDIIPPESQLAFHIYYVEYENTLTCKRISWDLEGNDVLKIFFYFLYV